MIISKIVKSSTQPNTNNIWLLNNQLLSFNNGEWTPIILDTDPIKDGLVFWIDGNSIDNKDEIVDLIGHVKFTPYNDDTEIGQGYVLGRVVADTNVLYPVKTSTIEIVVRNRQNLTQNVSWFLGNNIFSSKIDGICIGISMSNGLLISQKDYNSFQLDAVKMQGCHTISVSEKQIVHNIDYYSNHNTGRSYFVDGKFNSFLGDINKLSEVLCVRIYNRQLSKEEMIFNQMQDVKRYKLQLSSTALYNYNNNCIINESNNNQTGNEPYQ